MAEHTVHESTNEDKVVQAFKALRQKAKRLGINDSSLLKVESLNKLKKPSSTRHIAAVVVCLFAIAIGCGIFAFKKEIVTPKMLAQFAADYILDFDLEKENCFLPMPEIILDMFRPPVDCQVCKNVSQVDRVRGISPKEFIQKYAYTGRPVVIEDGMRNWTAHNYFSFEFFKQIYSPDSPVMKNRDPQCQFFPYKTSFHSLEEVFQMPEKDAKMEGKPWYIGWSNCDSEAANVLRKHYQTPYFLPETSESSKTDWIFMGCPGYGAHLHFSVKKSIICHESGHNHQKDYLYNAVSVMVLCVRLRNRLLITILFAALSIPEEHHKVYDGVDDEKQSSDESQDLKKI
ncbi:hypothetical protein QZH41_001539 [Actinostola sp. cb2023]|nr:hypothetical protein QZH41_001539 [Actinostola sp. cb2023]